jgi:membrane protein implicated in regulation of membrane protease activity
LHFANGALTGFGSIIINSFGFSHFDSVLLTGAVGGGVLFNCITAGLLGAMFKNARLWLVMACETPVILGACLVLKLDWSIQMVLFLLLSCVAGWLVGR